MTSNFDTKGVQQSKWNQLASNSSCHNSETQTDCFAKHSNINCLNPMFYWITWITQATYMLQGTTLVYKVCIDRFSRQTACCMILPVQTATEVSPIWRIVNVKLCFIRYLSFLCALITDFWVTYHLFQLAKIISRPNFTQHCFSVSFWVQKAIAILVVGVKIQSDRPPVLQLSVAIWVLITVDLNRSCARVCLQETHLKATALFSHGANEP